jgi:hypothetical protein
MLQKITVSPETTCYPEVEGQGSLDQHVLGMKNTPGQTKKSGNPRWVRNLVPFK